MSTVQSQSVPASRPADVPDVWECGVQLTNTPRAVHVARRTVRTALVAFGVEREAAEIAELLTSELVSNVVKHADSPLYVRTRALDGVVRVSVWDNHPELPQPLPPSTTEAFGRGLYLVHQLAHSWGQYPLNPTTPAATPGKVTWFELTT